MIQLEELWREHKAFIVAVGAGLVAFLGGLSIVSWSDGRTGAISRTNQKLRAEIAEGIDALAGREGYEAGVGLALGRSLIPELRASVEFAARPDFELKDGESPFIAYRQAIERVESARAEALRKNISCPEDMGLQKDPPEERVGIALAGADLTERALRELIASGVRRVEELRPADAEYVRLAAAEQGAKDAEAGAQGASPVDAGGLSQWLRRIPLRVGGVATIDALELFLSSFQRSGSCLELGAMKLSRAEEGEVKFALELAALRLVPEAEAAGAKAQAGGGQRRSTRPSGGRLR